MYCRLKLKTFLMYLRSLRSNQYLLLSFSRSGDKNLIDNQIRDSPLLTPMFFLLQNNKIVSKVEGAKAAELSNAVAKFAKGVLGANTASNAVSQTTEPVRDLQSRLKALVTSAPVMIFIKGTPQQPRCGFSRQLVDLLAEQNVRYSSFNILADEDVRQGEKHTPFAVALENLSPIFS
jgi:hypothetical protein